MLLLCGAIFIALGLILRFFPPKSINSIYGYRTPFSMKNQETWDEAQKYGGTSMAILGVCFIIVGVIENISSLPQFGNTILLIIGVVIMIVVDEVHLRNKFK